MAAKMEGAIMSAAGRIEGYHKKHDKNSTKDAQTNDVNGPHEQDGETGGNGDGQPGGKPDTGDTKGPPGGYDDTPIPRAPFGYTVKFTFHRATNLPMADINSFSSDPYILATLITGLPTRHKEDPALSLRTPTVRRETEPVWDTEWVVANVPASGFRLKCRIYDEDPADHDDRLGNATIEVHTINENWTGIQERAYKIKKRMGSKRAYLMRAFAVGIGKTHHMDGSLFVSVDVLGKTQGPEGDESGGGRAYTMGPMWWTKHYSPMLGRIANRKEPDEKSQKSGKEGKKEQQAERYNFQANQFQLHGSVPPELYHRFVEFKPFVKRMFTGSGIQGFLLSKALHHQHARVYNFDRTTEYGAFPKGPNRESTLKFLDLVHYAQGGRIFTYVLTLDALFRFTETGKEFGIDFLSKHTMHSDVNTYIAYSGEFFVRRLKHKNRPTPEQHLHETPEEAEQENQGHRMAEGGNDSRKEDHVPHDLHHGDDQTEESPPDDFDGGSPDSENVQDPRYYELIIDNDSGTYRPNAKLLPLLKRYLQQTLPGLHIVTLDCQADAELQQKMKKEQRDKKKQDGDHIIYRQASRGSSISSSDISDLDEMEGREHNGVWQATGKDYQRKAKARGQRYKGIVKGRDQHQGGPPNANGNDNAEASARADSSNVMAESREYKQEATDGHALGTYAEGTPHRAEVEVR